MVAAVSTKVMPRDLSIFYISLRSSTKETIVPPELEVGDLFLVRIHEVSCSGRCLLEKRCLLTG